MMMMMMMIIIIMSHNVGLYVCYCLYMCTCVLSDFQFEIYSTGSARLRAWW